MLVKARWADGLQTDGWQSQLQALTLEGHTPVISAARGVRGESQKEKHHEPTCETIFAKCHMLSCKAPAVCLAPSNTVSVSVFVIGIQR